MGDKFPVMFDDRLLSPIPCPGTETFRRIVAFCEENSVEVLSRLPWIAAEMVPDLGFAGVFELVRDLSGARVHVPRAGGGWGRGLSTDTLDKFALSSDSFMMIIFPSAKGVFEAVRGAAVDIELKRGLSIRGIARRYGVTERGVRKRNNKFFKPLSKDKSGTPAVDDPKIFSGIPDGSTNEFSEIVKFCDDNAEAIIKELPGAAAALARTGGFRFALETIRERGGVDNVPGSLSTMDAIRRVAAVVAIRSGRSKRASVRCLGIAGKTMDARTRLVGSFDPSTGRITTKELPPPRSLSKPL